MHHNFFLEGDFCFHSCINVHRADAASSENKLEENSRGGLTEFGKVRS